ncbi:MAG: hypothetical protein EOO67_19905, partial [Microbacterium sp.]
MNDDETRRLLRAVDPARSLPSADPVRVAALLEDTMSQPVDEAPSKPTRSRWLILGGVAAAAAVATVVAIGANGSNDDDVKTAGT